MLYDEKSVERRYINKTPFCDVLDASEVTVHYKCVDIVELDI